MSEQTEPNSDAGVDASGVAQREPRDGPAPRTDAGPLADQTAPGRKNQLPTPEPQAPAKPTMAGAEALMDSPRRTMKPPHQSTGGTLQPDAIGLERESQPIDEDKRYSDGTLVTDFVRKGKRQQWGQRRFRLPSAPPHPGFHYHTFNDIPGRLELAKGRGYRHVCDEKGLPIHRVVDENTGVKGYLMEIPDEFYDEDFAEKQAVADQADIAMLHHSMADGGYRPHDPYSQRPVTQMNVVRGREPG